MSAIELLQLVTALASALAAGWLWAVRSRAGRAAQAEGEARLQAQAALIRSDVQVLRCYEAGVPFPPRWADYRQVLRDIGSGRRPGPVPDHPDWPRD